MPVSTQSGADAFKNLYADWTLGSGTNWDQGLYAVAKAEPRYDAVVVLTDGNPTYWNNPRQGDGSHTHFADAEGGIFSANAVKAKGSRVVAVGVGRGVEGVSGLNLRALSGPEAFDGTNPLTADYYQTADLAGAGAALTELALSNCAGTLSVVKQIVPEDTTGEDITGATPAGEGWGRGWLNQFPTGIGQVTLRRAAVEEGCFRSAEGRHSSLTIRAQRKGLGHYAAARTRPASDHGCRPLHPDRAPVAIRPP